jgi:hypothetical protein
VWLLDTQFEYVVILRGGEALLKLEYECCLYLLHFTDMQQHRIVPVLLHLNSLNKLYKYVHISLYESQYEYYKSCSWLRIVTVQN